MRSVARGRGRACYGLVSDARADPGWLDRAHVRLMRWVPRHSCGSGACGRERGRGEQGAGGQRERAQGAAVDAAPTE